MDSSIVFDGEVNERSLDKSAKQINERFEDAGQIQVDAETDGLGLDGFSDGGDMGMGDRGGGGMGGGALGMGALASRIPKPIAGVAAGAALPVGLVGAVGVGMLSAMHSASARLQTSTTLLGQAWNNVWRPLGDSLDQLFVRDAVKDVHSATTEFENTWRSGQQWAALIGLEGDMVGWLADLTQHMPMVGTALRGAEIAIQTIEDIFEGKIDPWQIIKTTSRSVWDWITTETQDVWDWITTGSRSVWGWIRTGTRDVWGWIDTPDRSVWGWIDTPVKSIWDFITEGDGGGGGGNGGGGGDDRPWWDPFDGPIIPGIQSGGRIERSGVAQVHRGELVADPDRLVSELAGAIRQAGGGRGGATVDMGNVERKLDEVNRNLKRLSQAMSQMGISVDGQQFGEVMSGVEQGNIIDTDPTV